MVFKWHTIKLACNLRRFIWVLIYLDKKKKRGNRNKLKYAQFKLKFMYHVGLSEIPQSLIKLETTNCHIRYVQILLGKNVKAHKEKEKNKIIFKNKKAK